MLERCTDVCAIMPMTPKMRCEAWTLGSAEMADARPSSATVLHEPDNPPLLRNTNSGDMPTTDGAKKAGGAEAMWPPPCLGAPTKWLEDITSDGLPMGPP